jgi:hypothetical protein
MSEPKFATGQQVHYRPHDRQDSKSGSLFEVLWRMPFEGHEYRYWIRNTAGIELIAGELQLEIAV